MNYRATADWPYHISSGGAVWKIVDGKRLYAVLYRGERFGDGANSWHLPHGTLEEGETLEACAIREIREEAGLIAEPVVYLGMIHFHFYEDAEGIDYDKTNHYFLCKYVSGDGTEMDAEHDEVYWLEADEAIAKFLTLSDRETLAIDRGEVIIARAEDYFKTHNTSI